MYEHIKNLSIPRIL